MGLYSGVGLYSVMGLYSGMGLYTGVGLYSGWAYTQGEFIFWGGVICRTGLTATLVCLHQVFSEEDFNKFEEHYDEYYNEYDDEDYLYDEHGNLIGLKTRARTKPPPHQQEPTPPPGGGL